MVEVPVLTTLDGTPAATHWLWGERGEAWRLTDAATARFRRRFVRASVAIKPETRRRYYRSRGFDLAVVEVPLRVEITESGVRIPVIP